MTDMLVRLYALPPLEPELAAMAAHGITIRRAIPPEKHVVLGWVGQHFSPNWASECDVAFSHQPPGIWLATQGPDLVGFACYDAVALGFFGPTGVAESMRGKGAGRALLLAALHAMRDTGYGYGIIGGVGPADFYAKAAGATIIEDSTPGIYAGMLKTR
jgi:GNAT superfamily N-acetyltransferase